MSAKDLIFTLLGEDKSASRVMGEAASNAEKSTARIGGAFSKVGGIIGGEFGEVLNKTGEGFAQVGERSGKMSAAVVIGGAAVTGLGVALQSMGAKDKQATDQLRQAITDSGKSWGSYKEDVEKAIKKQESFGNSAIDTQEALRKLTQSTNDPKKALEMMGLTANLAASRHISLSDASTMLSKVLSGHGGRTLSEYGITMGKSGDKAKDTEAAIASLSKKLDGQASASMDNFGGFVAAARVRLEDFGGQVGQVAGPILTVLGPALMGAGTVMDLMTKRRAAAAVAALADAAAVTVEAGATDVATAATVGLNLAFFMSPVGLVVAGIAALAATLGIVSLATQAATTTTDSYADSLKADNNVIGDNVRAQAAKTLVESGAIKSAQSLGISASQLTDAAMGNADAAKLVSMALADQTTKIDTTARAHGQLTRYGLVYTDAQKSQKTAIADVSKAYTAQSDEIKKNIDQTTQVVAAQPTVVSAAQKMAKGLGLTADAYTAVTDAQKLSIESSKFWKDQLDILNGGAQSLEQANISLAQNYTSTTKTITDNIDKLGRKAATSLDINTAAGLANHQLILQSVQDAQNQSDAIVKAEGGTAKAREDGRLALEKQRTSLKLHLKDLGLDAGAVDALVDSEMKIPPKVLSKIEVDTANAVQKIVDLNAALAAVPASARTSVGVDVSRLPSKWSGPRLATGGTYGAGGLALVGENGPEIVKLPGGATVYPTGTQMGGGGGGGGTTVVINVSGVMASDKTSMAKLMQDAWNHAVKTGGVPRNGLTIA